MMENVLKIIEKELSIDLNINETIDNRIDVAHNYAALENHYGRNLVIHRKGATRAYEGKIGIIPGSQGSSSYMVKGKGCKESFKSCSHGAGRSMSITKAIATLSFDKEISKLNSKKTLHTIKSKQDLGESDGAYKDIEKVISNQEDLIKILVKLISIATIKGKNRQRKSKKNKK